MKAPTLKLVVFPGQLRGREASLMLTGDEDGSSPRFWIEATSANAKHHDDAWKRPFGVGLRRYGLDAARRYGLDAARYHEP